MGVSVIDVEEMTKAYTTYSLNFVENLIGGVSGNIWGMDEYLVVIDGIVRDANNVLPTEIEQITVLKGPAAVVLYGSRASKGVIQITTKRGQVGEPVIKVLVNTGIHTPKAILNIGSAEYMTLAVRPCGDGLSPLFKRISTGSHQVRILTVIRI